MRLGDLVNYKLLSKFALLMTLLGNCSPACRYLPLSRNIKHHSKLRLMKRGGNLSNNKM